MREPKLNRGRLGLTETRYGSNVASLLGEPWKAWGFGNIRYSEK